MALVFNMIFANLLGGGGSPGFGKCPAQHGLPILVVVVAGGLIPVGFTIDDAFDLVDFVSLLTDSVSDVSIAAWSLIFYLNVQHYVLLQLFISQIHLYKTLL